MLWCGVVWCGAVRCGVVRCGVVRCGVVRCGAVRCGVVWCGAAGPQILDYMQYNVHLYMHVRMYVCVHTQIRVIIDRLCS